MRRLGIHLAVPPLRAVVLSTRGGVAGQRASLLEHVAGVRSPDRGEHRGEVGLDWLLSKWRLGAVLERAAPFCLLVVAVRIHFGAQTD